MLALLVGSVLAVAALAYVLMPLLRGGAILRAEAHAPDLPPESSALDALREIEFDQATGKLSAEDYSSLRASYTPLALAELRAREGADANAVHGVIGGTDAAAPDPAEELIRRAKTRERSCATHGPRPERDAIFCSECGRYLGSACLKCGAAVESGSARFCTECGESLAA